MRSLSALLRRSGGFSLVELVIVIAIIGIISIFVIPAATTIIMGNDLTRSAQLVAAQLATARQVATTKNHQVEVRLISFADPEAPGENVAQPLTWKFRGIQLLEVFDNGNVAQIGKIERLPGAMMMDSGRLSSLLDQGGIAEPQQKSIPLVDALQSGRTDLPPLPRVPKADALKYKYVPFRFLPDGSTNLNPSGKWYVTMYAINDQKKLASAGQPGVNYFTIQLDPANGSARTFRPMAGRTAGTGAGGGGGKK